MNISSLLSKKAVAIGGLSVGLLSYFYYNYSEYQTQAKESELIELLLNKSPQALTSAYHIILQEIEETRQGKQPLTDKQLIALKLELLAPVTAILRKR